MSESRSPLRIHVIGGSIAGLAAACAALRHHPNCQVTVHERSPPGGLEERGAGIGGDFTILKKIIGKDPRDLGFRYVLPMGAICERDTRSRKQVRMKGVWTDEDGLLRCTTTYDNIQSTVSKAFLELGGKYVYDHSLDRMEPQSSGTTKLYFSDGSTEEADLVICADGFASPCRKALYATKGLDGSYKYTGYLIWRGILYPDEIDDPEVLKALLPNGGKERSDLWMQPVFNGPSPYALYSLYYPVPSKHQDPPSRGPIRINWTWFQYATQPELHEMLRDRFGKQHETSLSAGQLRKEVAEKMLRDAEGKLDGDGIQLKLAKRIVELDRLFVQGIYEFEPEYMAFPSHNAILVGDAAAVATPATGMGAGKAVREAGFLVDLFKKHPWDVQKLCAEFEKARLAETKEIVRTGAKLQSNWHWIAKHTVWDGGVYSGEPWQSAEEPGSGTQKEEAAGRLEIGYSLQWVPSKL